MHEQLYYLCGPYLNTEHAVAQWLRHMLQAERSRVRDSTRRITFFLIYLILPAALGPGAYSASNRIEYQKQEKIVSGE
jgi:hypothetical protein